MISLGEIGSQSVVEVAALSISSVATSSECDVNLLQVSPPPPHPTTFREVFGVNALGWRETSCCNGCLTGAKCMI